MTMTDEVMKMKFTNRLTTTLSFSNYQDTNNVLVASGIVVGSLALLYQINWPRLIFRSIFGVLAPTKERLWPSDSTELSPQIRGMAWMLRSGPPPPHDVKPIRTMMRYFWPNVWPAIGYDIRIETLPTPRGEDSETILIWPRRRTNIESDDDNDTALIHIHGGGMIAGTTGTERGLAVELARRLQVPVLSIDYRLVPEASVEEAVQDVVDSYIYFTKTYPQFCKISFLGGSAGAGHSLLATLKLKQLGVSPQPTSLVLSSPAPGMEFLPPEDSYGSWKSIQENADVDGYMAGEFYQYVTSVVYGSETNKEYFRTHLSDLRGLPPCFITVGTYEVVLDGARKLAKNLTASKVKATYKEYWKMQHCHFTFFEFTSESSKALDELIEWLQKSWK